MDGRRRRVPRLHASSSEQARGFKRLAHRREAKLREQAAQARLAQMQVRVVTEAREPVYADSRLLGIDLPGMQVERERALARLVDLAQPPARHPVWKQPK